SKKASAWLWMVTRDPQVDLGIRHSLASLLRQLEFLESETDLLDETLHELATAPRYAAQVAELTQLSGVGELTALVFLTELGDLTRFENRRQIGAYLGLVPRSYESGAAGDRKGHITRQGQARVRRVLCQAAWTRIIAGGCDRAA